MRRIISNIVLAIAFLLMFVAVGGIFRLIDFITYDRLLLIEAGVPELYTAILIMMPVLIVLEFIAYAFLYYLAFFIDPTHPLLKWEIRRYKRKTGKKPHFIRLYERLMGGKDFDRIIEERKESEHRSKVDEITRVFENGDYSRSVKKCLQLLEKKDLRREMRHLVLGLTARSYLLQGVWEEAAVYSTRTFSGTGFSSYQPSFADHIVRVLVKVKQGQKNEVIKVVEEAREKHGKVDALSWIEMLLIGEQDLIQSETCFNSLLEQYTVVLSTVDKNHLNDVLSTKNSPENV